MIDLRCVDRGFKNRNAKWRLSYSAKPEIWKPEQDARCSEYVYLKRQNLAKVLYVRGSKNYANSLIRLLINE